MKRITPAEFAEQFTADSKIIDVRKLTEYSAEHIDNAYNKPLDSISEWARDLDDSEHFFLHCAGGYRSMIAASILNSHGIRNFTEIEGGFNGIKKQKNFLQQTLFANPKHSNIMKLRFFGIILASVLALNNCKTTHSAKVSKANIKDVVTSSDVTLVDVRILSSIQQERLKMPSTFLWQKSRTAFTP